MAAIFGFWLSGCGDSLVMVPVPEFDAQTRTIILASLGEDPEVRVLTPVEVEEQPQSLSSSAIWFLEYPFSADELGIESGLVAEGQRPLPKPSRTLQYADGWRVSEASDALLNLKVRAAVPSTYAVSTADELTCVLLGGEVRCTGIGSDGQLGTDFVPERGSLEPVPGVGRARSIESGSVFTCVLDELGRVLCWGGNFFGQLGRVDTSGRDFHVAPVHGLSDVVRIAAGSHHSCAIDSTGGLHCWGDNRQRETSPKPDALIEVGIPEPVELPRPVRDVCAGNAYSCAIDGDSNVRCWGDRFEAIQLIEGIEGAKALECGGRHTCVKTTDARTYCFGENGARQISDTGDSSPVTLVSDSDELVRLGPESTCFGGQGALRCRGAETFASKLEGGSIIDFDVSLSHAVAMSESGQLSGVGSNGRGQLGIRPPEYWTTPGQVDTGLEVQSLVLGGDATCLGTNGGYVCAGLDLGQLLGERVQPSLASLAVMTSSLSMGLNHACGLRDSRVFCWGSNIWGQAGDPGQPRIFEPTEVQLPEPARMVRAGTEATCAISTDGGLWCWGRNQNGQTGHGRVTDREPPEKVELPDPALDVRLGREHACVLTTSNRVYCFGNNSDGQVRTANTNVVSAPLEVTEVAGSVEIGTIRETNCSRLLDGRVMCWGSNALHQIDASAEVEVRPRLLVDAPRARSLVMGGPLSATTCLISEDQKLYCRGRNDDGQVGVGSRENVATFTRATGIDRVISAAAGNRHICAVDEDAHLYCWGYGGYGQLGRSFESSLFREPVTF